jgi:hypothetical protein
MISVVRYMLFALFLLAASAASFAQVSVGISVGFAPPPIPVYEQPICPQEGFIWTPGYWAWDADGDDYYWVPGTWVAAPQVGYLWTPGYWGWGGGGYFFHEGYWGPHVGWYGGVSYGFGYFGHGYEGGRWDHDRFFYNRSVTNVNVTEIHNVYNTTVINRNENRVSYNGGDGGLRERPSRDEENYSRERHIPPISVQNQHIQEARGNRELRASYNQGRPPIAATQHPGAFRGSAVVSAKEAGGHWEPPANRGANNNAARPDNNPNRPSNGRNNNDRPPNAGNMGNNANRPSFSHANEITPHDRPPAPNTGNPRLDQKYQQQQDKLYNKQQQEHQKLQQKQGQDHQRLAQQNANDTRRQQVEQRHQQQTQQMEQRHTQQQQQMQQRQQPKQQSQPRGQSQGGGKPNRP